jgi:hypothetical protein
LLDWTKERLSNCGASPEVQYTSEALPEPEATSFALRFDYDSGRYFRWRGDLSHSSGFFDADLGSGHATMTTPVSLLSPEATLGEAMFF